MPTLLRRGAAAPRSGVAAVRRAYGGAPLRVKLVAIVLLLVVGALAGSGFVAATTLRHYLVGRVDTQLASAADPIESQPQVAALTGRDGGHGHAGNDGDADNRNHLPSLYVAEVTNAAGVPVYESTNSLADPGQPLPAFPHVTGAATKARGTGYLTVNAVRGDESWRVRVAAIPLADGSTGTLLVAQSLSDVSNTVNRLVGLFVIIGAVAVVVLAGVGYLVVRASLRPLREVERTAARIAGGDLSHRVPDADPRTEVGHLAGALNTMLARIETAFAEREESEAAARRSEDQARRSEELMRRSEAAARRSEDRR
jgi:two-component system, OmpR family, sensor kinase